jgi:diguanylate cyclase (GGDEF)-like protein
VSGSRARQDVGVHRRLRAFVAAVAAVAVLCVVGATVLLVQSPPRDWAPVWLVVGLMVVSRLFVVPVRVGGTRMQFDWAEAALIVALVVVDAPVVVLGAAFAVAAVTVWRRLDPLKIALNVASTVVAATAAVWIARTVGGPHLDPATVPGALAILLGMLAYPLLNHLAVAVAVGLSRGVPALDVFTGGFSGLALTSVGNVTAAFGVLALARVNPLFLLLSPPILWLVHQAYAARLRAGGERAAWQRLATAIHDLNRLDEDEVVGAAVRGAAELFDAGVVEIETVDGAGTRRLTRGTAAGDLWRGAPGEEVRPVPTAYSTALVDSAGVALGEIRLCSRSVARLGEREEFAMATFAAALASALGNARDHDRLHAVASRTEHEATHDALTGLPNRICLLQRGEYVRARDPGVTLGLLLLDFDHFKEINDTLGHDAGDLVLTSAAVRLLAAVRKGEMLARLGGDEFAVLLPGPAGAEERAHELLATLGEPVVVGGVALTVEASVGMASTDGPQCDTAELLRRAEVAMYEAKRTARSVTGYDASRDAGSPDRLALAAELRAALDCTDQLVLHLQPSIDLNTGAPLGAEALVRWQHPRRGPISPDDFVPVVEHTDLVRPFSRYVVDRALAVSASWVAEGLRLPIAVNLSARSLLDRDLPADLGALLARHRVPAELLVLEITETVVMSELEVVEEVLDGLRGLGVQLSVDDFGTGYSSLTFLARVAVDEVKIDQSFVRQMDTSREAAAIVRTTIELARALNLRVVAEGVERADQRATLTRLGCHAAQGFHLYPPMPVPEATAAIRAALARVDPPGVVPLLRAEEG